MFTIESPKKKKRRGKKNKKQKNNKKKKENKKVIDYLVFESPSGIDEAFISRDVKGARRSPRLGDSGLWSLLRPSSRAFSRGERHLAPYAQARGAVGAHLKELLL